MWNDTAVTRALGIRYPIVQGPFGGTFSTTQLVAAVSNCGGLGSFGAHMLTPERILRQAAEIRAATDKPFAMNLWVSGQDDRAPQVTVDEFAEYTKCLQPFYEELGVEPPTLTRDSSPGFDNQVEAILETRPAAFSFVFGIPAPAILDECRGRGICTIGAATTLDEGEALEAAGADMIVASGFEAGGHRPSFLKRAEDSLTGTLALVSQIVERVKIPVIAAGGIANARGIKAALTLGAEAVQIGTAFLACEESGAHPLHRERLFGPDARYTQLSRAYSGRLARFIANRYLRAAPNWPHPLPYPIQSQLVDPIRQYAIAQGKGDLMPFYSGQGAPLLRHRHAAALLESLVQELDLAPTTS